MRNTVWSLVRGTRAGRFVRPYVEGSCVCAAPMVLSRSVCLPEGMRCRPGLSGAYRCCQSQLVVGAAWGQTTISGRRQTGWDGEGIAAQQVKEWGQPSFIRCGRRKNRSIAWVDGKEGLLVQEVNVCGCFFLSSDLDLS